MPKCESVALARGRGVDPAPAPATKQGLQALRPDNVPCGQRPKPKGGLSPITKTITTIT